LRNGDAHLKNFGMVYDDVRGEARLAPIYDLVTTSAYVSKDSLALTLNGTTQWPAAKELQRLGATTGGGTAGTIRQSLERIDSAIQETATDVRSYIKQHPEFAAIGERMMQEWEAGSANSLRRP